ncbi:anaerobic ribonucleoside-triphosphate reductase activating protein [Prosthecochloris sp. HL-130-GSB]|jgi:pyruvate formate lyase activating enzyme|uniref:anaerobic ribonucleoside-triphosphate reductase activating protein n=1 Tax=Prosthecochloris sp. HL-130-GSB TaxID=1974213 RepID=UPI000A1C03E1|nr:anaerobic ribonucleoside-triphosphate reductase activating protein [Prosthecochloris sp. HL-130-GSB]ARM31036.1 anaerobic ribonucleoside-triphosphate reductase activating protein [Prosthecochloris sp. HL-130-GSB]
MMPVLEGIAADVKEGADALAGIRPGGFVKQSFIDYPGHIAAVVYTAGCNMRCRYCHNPGLVDPRRLERLSSDEICGCARWLSDNRHLLDAVVVSGGEPTLHSGLVDALRWLKSLGLKVKLDTNGSRPGVLENVLTEGLVDKVSMDLKARPDLESYRSICGDMLDEAMLGAVMRSLDLLSAWKGDVEIRSTLLKPFHDSDSIRKMRAAVAGVWTVQRFRDDFTLLPCHALPISPAEVLAALVCDEPISAGMCFR